MDSTYVLSIVAIILIMFIAGGAYLFARKRAHAPGHRVHGTHGTGGEEKAAHS